MDMGFGAEVFKNIQSGVDEGDQFAVLFVEGNIFYSMIFYLDGMCAMVAFMLATYR